VAANIASHDENLKYRFNTPMLMGYLFLGLVFVGAVSSVYYWENKKQTMQTTVHSSLGRVESGETVVPINERVIPTPDGQMCIIDTVTGERIVPMPTPPNYNGECE
jgi:hypothetical protein